MWSIRIILAFVFNLKNKILKGSSNALIPNKLKARKSTKNLIP